MESIPAFRWNFIMADNPNVWDELRRIADKTTASADTSSMEKSLHTETAADRAVLGICELLGLLFGLPFGDEFYHNKSFSEISAWHWLYLVIGIFFAGAGFMFPWLKTRSWIPNRISAGLSSVALDMRIWIVVLLLIFIYVTAPEIYQRATRPITNSITPISFTSDQLSLRKREFIELEQFISDKAETALWNKVQLPSFFAPASRMLQIERVKQYGDSVVILFDGLRSITQRYPFSDIDDEFSTSRDVANMRMISLGLYQDCLDLLKTVPNDPSIELNNVVTNKLKALQSEFEQIAAWRVRTLASLSKRKQDGL